MSTTDTKSLPHVQSLVHNATVVKVVEREEKMVEGPVPELLLIKSLTATSPVLLRNSVKVKL